MLLFVGRSTITNISLLSALAFCVGCGGTQVASGRQEILTQYLAAIEGNQPDRAYALLDEKVQRRVSKSEFVSRWKSSPQELRIQAQQIRESLSRPVKATAQLGYGAGIQVKLTSKSDQGWRIEEGILLSFQTKTPLDAIRAFLRALEQGNLSSILKLMAKSEQEGIRDWIERLKKGLGEEIEVTGNKAKLRLGPDSWVRLKKEDGQWKISKIK